MYHNTNFVLNEWAQSAVVNNLKCIIAEAPIYGCGSREEKDTDLSTRGRITAKSGFLSLPRLGVRPVTSEQRSAVT